jgi:dTDP-4-dehydrorhamnose 3,5-epimerase
MRFGATKLSGAYLIDLERRSDDRGYFARTFCEREFAAHGLPTRFPQCNLSHNRSSGTLRGMHFSALPSLESKVVRCARGAIYDVIIDLRPTSSTRFQWLGVELSHEEGSALFVPAGFAHGFLTLADDTDVFYQMGDFYRPEADRGFRYDDPFFAVKWPTVPKVISERDSTYPDFDPTTLDD